MSLRILLQESPRIIVLASEHHALIFRYGHSDLVLGSDRSSRKPNSQAPTAKCTVEDDYDSQTHDGIDPDVAQYAAPDDAAYGHGHDPRENTMDHPCLELKKMLSGGTFYFSVDFDLINRLQDRLSEGSAFDIDSLDEDFLWNGYMINPLIMFRSKLSKDEKAILDDSRMLTSAIRGFVLTVTISAAASPLRGLKSNFPSTLTVLSRLSCRRAGTRFNSRGIDDDGNVANFVESETVFWHPSGLCFSYAQVRGSVPIFWEQATGLLPNQQKIQITRSPEATQPAFDKHFENLELNYGTVHILNLMSATKLGEVELTARYQQHVQRSPLNQTIGMRDIGEQRLIQSQFDFHAETKGPGGYEAASMVRRLIQDRADSFAYLLCDRVDGPRSASRRSEQISGEQSTVILQQQGVFRVNCLDCLDRTNLIQTILSQMAIELFLNHRSERATADFWMRHSSIWADNGDALSKIYAGTGALKSSFTRHGKMSLAGAFADARKSATRMYINNFADKGRQNTIDMLLVSATRSQFSRAHEFSTSEKIHIWAGTFNLNGRGAGVKENLSAWLCPQLNSQAKQPEILAVGFQEIVELSPQQIMSTDPSRRQIWEEAVRMTINKKTKDSEEEEYVLLRSGQLVGAALIIFVKASSLKKIKNVEGSVKKTGMSGMAGNKGAVAIRMDYADTRICLVTAHLAAGFANYEERNRDYRTISHGLRFQRNRSIDDHDTVIWLGDFNYRIGLGDDKVRRLIQAGDLGTLYQNDQLNLQMIAGHVFPFYSESQITFLPTYKYNNGTDEYDTSEKARIPAWCDRILRKGSNLKQIEYATAPLRFSDHRPVYATFQCTINNVDEQRKEELSRLLYDRRVKDIADPTANDDEKTDEDHAGYVSVAVGLPPASSDCRKWWLDNGLPARSQVQPPRSNMMLNPGRPANPFTPTNEPDWVMVPGSKKLERTERRISAPPTPPSRRGTRRVPLPDTSPPDSSSNAQASGTSQDVSISPTFTNPSRSSTASSITRKPAPPVPKKPPLLSTSSTGPDNRHRPPPKDSTMNGHRAPDHRTNTQVNTIFPPPPGRRGTGATAPEAVLPLNVTPTFSTGARYLTQQRPGPPSTSNSPIPPVSRRIGNDVTVRRDLLDDVDEGAKAIPSLQPQRPT
ncbi:MAG: hypothetical protein Q9200_006428 [Gallowayella weberi]